jgi:hypothetical protein
MAAMGHLDILAAAMAHPFGIIAFAGVLAVGVLSLGELATGRDLLGLLRPGLWWALVAIIGLFGGWVYKLAFGLATGQYPLR